MGEGHISFWSREGFGVGKATLYFKFSLLSKLIASNSHWSYTNLNVCLKDVKKLAIVLALGLLVGMLLGRKYVTVSRVTHMETS